MGGHEKGAEAAAKASQIIADAYNEGLESPFVLSQELAEKNKRGYVLESLRNFVEYELEINPIWFATEDDKKMLCVKVIWKRHRK